MNVSGGDKPTDAGMSHCLAAAQSGSTEAVGRLFELCRHYLLAVANHELDADLQAKVGPSDLVQETLLEAQRDFVRFHGNCEAEILAWLRRILLNNVANVRDHYRSVQKRSLDREVSLERVLAGKTDESIVRQDPSPSKLALADERVALVEAAIAALPSQYQQALRLRHQENCSFEEVGQRMGRSAEAARKLWARAVELLKTKLKSANDNR
jgi:RNA polymerase sigma-70 factor (ECF subfamily)